MVVPDRAISTVMDVSLALLIISATVLLIGTYVHTETESIDSERGDHALQSLSGSTVTITYDISEPNEAGERATDSEHYEPLDDLDPDDVGELYEITTYGSAMDVLAEAAQTNLVINDTEVWAYGHSVEQSVDGAIQDRLVGSDGRTFTVATWEPYDGAAITGTATAGNTPPHTEDVSSASIEVSANPDSLEAEHLATKFEVGETASPGDSIEDGFDAIGREIAETIIEGYFPPTQTQYTLESSLTETAVTLYNYRQLADVVGVDIDDSIRGPDANAAQANQVLLEGETADETGLEDFVADDLRDSPAGEEIRKAYDDLDESPSDDETEAFEAVFDETIATDTVDVTVQTWD
ncbi:DUF7284 family protein [Natrarchaeobaculum sulfurireducens]|uniref:Pilin/flagellin n=1 Tax=Natrarchaeobaculum sulfurireducens TaxID=2044521 RepID=A0A346PFN5_9EURY|nr:hypothetical protein [Natrarchaeobaculum sulfurireducens]AXR78330.1 Pilin/flagellin [Natrarchaeobaculum sulfurireducens]